MSTAIGFVLPGAPLPDGLLAAGTGPVRAVLGSLAALAEPRARLRACLACAPAAPAFLPLAPRAPRSAQEALALAESAGTALAVWLEAHAGQAEAILAAHPEPEPPPSDDTSGRAWLLARVTAAKAREESRARQYRLLCAIAPPGSTQRLLEEGRLVRLCLRLPRTEAAAGIAALAARARAHPVAQAAHISLTGPWPLFDFAPSMEPA